VPNHAASALCVLPSPDSDQLELIAAASSTDHIIRVYRIDDNNPLYQLEGHTDTGRAIFVVLLSFIICCTSSDNR